MGVRCRGFSLLLLVFALQGCGESSQQIAQSPLVGTGDNGRPLQDGENIPGGDGQLPANRPFEDPLPLGPEGDSGILLDDKFYPLDSALGDIWGVEQNFFNVDFTLSNGRYRLETTEIDGDMYTLLVPAATSAVVHAELYSPGEQFSFESYTHSAEGALAGTAWFDQAWVGVDEDLSGDVEQDEHRSVVGGTVVFSGSLPDVELHLNLLLETGQYVEGHYGGLFDFTRR